MRPRSGPNAFTLPLRANIRMAISTAITTGPFMPSARCIFSEGFEDPPRIRGAIRPITVGGNPIRGWWLEWKVSDRSRAMVGVEVYDLSVPFDRPRIFDLGAMPGTDTRRIDDEGRGMAFLGQYQEITIGENKDFILSDHLRNLRSVTLLVR